MRLIQWFMALSTVLYVCLQIIDSAAGNVVTTPIWMLLMDVGVGVLALVLMVRGGNWSVLFLAYASVATFGPAMIALARLSQGEDRRQWWGGLAMFAGGWVIRWQLPWSEPAPFHNTIWGIVLVGTTSLAIFATMRALTMRHHSKQLAIAAAVSQERAEIKREMHDVLAHRLSLVAMYSATLGDRVNMTDNERREIGEVMNTSVRDSLLELQAVLSNPNTNISLPSSQPRLEHLADLVAESESSEHPIVVRDNLQSTQAVDSMVQRHFYRVVQEGLTNARRHGKPGTTVLALDSEDHIVRVRIMNPTHNRTVHEGNGLSGIRERVRLCLGRLTIESSQDMFIVDATFPAEISNQGS